MKLKFNGENETFVIIDGKKYKTKDKQLEVKKDIADKILKNPKWEKIKTKSKEE
jgi:hypothetical protein